MLTLYFSRNSCAYAPHILLYDTGTVFDTVEIDFRSGAQNAPEFLRINPKGRVPALVTPEGILTENPAILLYIAQTHPDCHLAPSEPFALAQAQAFNMFLASTVHVAHAHKHRGARWADDPAAHAAMTAKVASNMAMYAGMIEEHYFTGPYVLGQRYSMCDPYLALITRWLRADGVALADFPKLQAHDALMRARPSMQSVLELYD
jgi:glutathione S-transferase